MNGILVILLQKKNFFYSADLLTLSFSEKYLSMWYASLVKGYLQIDHNYELIVNILECRCVFIHYSRVFAMSG